MHTLYALYIGVKLSGLQHLAKTGAASSSTRFYTSAARSRIPSSAASSQNAGPALDKTSPAAIVRTAVGTAYDRAVNGSDVTRYYHEYLDGRREAILGQFPDILPAKVQTLIATDHGNPAAFLRLDPLPDGMTALSCDIGTQRCQVRLPTMRML